MKKRITIFAISVLLVGAAWANPPQVLWNRVLLETYGWCYSLIAVPTGGYVMAGSFQLNETLDFMLVCTDSGGTQQWIRRYGGPNMDQCRHAERTTDGGYILVGYTESFAPAENGNSCVWLLKTDANGDSLWSRTYGRPSVSSWGECVRQTFDGGYIIAGGKNADSLMLEVGWLIKTDANGDTLWTREYPNFALTSVLQLREGGFLIAGSVYYQPFYNQMAAMFLSAFGDSVWFRQYSAGLLSTVRDVVELENGGFYLSGIANWSGREPDLVVLRLNSDGDSLWQRQVDGLGWDEAAALCIAQDGGCVSVGYTTSPVGQNADIWLTKLALDGAVEWNTTYSSEYSDIASTIVPLSDGGYMIAGWMYECFPGPCLWMARMTPELSDAVDPDLSPAAFSLAQNYPNPFNATTQIQFTLAREAQTRIEIFDLQGRLVSTLINNRYPAGTHSISFDGGRLSSGIYVYRMQVGSFSQNRKFVLLK